MATKTAITDLSPVYVTVHTIDGLLAFVSGEGVAYYLSRANAGDAKPGDRGELVRVKSEDGKNTVFRFEPRLC